MFMPFINSEKNITIKSKSLQELGSILLFSYLHSVIFCILDSAVVTHNYLFIKLIKQHPLGQNSPTMLRDAWDTKG